MFFINLSIENLIKIQISGNEMLMKQMCIIWINFLSVRKIFMNERIVGFLEIFKSVKCNRCSSIRFHWYSFIFFLGYRNEFLIVRSLIYTYWSAFKISIETYVFFFKLPTKIKRLIFLFFWKNSKTIFRNYLNLKRFEIQKHFNIKSL